MTVIVPLNQLTFGGLMMAKCELCGKLTGITVLFNIDGPYTHYCTRQECTAKMNAYSKAKRKRLKELKNGL